MDMEIHLATLLADMMPQASIIEALKQSILEYEKDGDATSVINNCIMLLHKYKIEKCGGVEKMMTEWENFQKINEAFEHTKNKS